MKVIALRGTANTGKSHTINVVYGFLLKDGYEQVPGHFRILGNPVFNDIMDMLTKNDVKVGIVGMGDYQRGEGSLTRLLNEIENKGCEIVICACRDIPGIEKAVTQYENHIFIDKTISSGSDNHRIVNSVDALRIIQAI